MLNLGCGVLLSFVHLLVLGLAFRRRVREDIAKGLIGASIHSNLGRGTLDEGGGAGKILPQLSGELQFSDVVRFDIGRRGWLRLSLVSRGREWPIGFGLAFWIHLVGVLVGIAGIERIRAIHGLRNWGRICLHGKVQPPATSVLLPRINYKHVAHNRFLPLLGRLFPGLLSVLEFWREGQGERPNYAVSPGADLLSQSRRCPRMECSVGDRVAISVRFPGGELR